MPQVAFFLSGLRGGGAQRRFVTLANALCQQNFSVDMLTALPAGPFRGELAPQVRIHALKIPAAPVARTLIGKQLRVLLSIPALSAYLHRHRPDAVVSISNPANVAALWARHLSGTGVPVITCVNVPPSIALRPGRRTLLRVLSRRWYPEADLAIANAGAVARDLEGFVPGLRGKVRTIPNPIDVDRIRARAAERPSHPWVSREGSPLVLAVGKLKPQKDYPTLLRAFQALDPTARLLVLGEGPLRARLGRLARRLGIAERTCFAGFVPNPYSSMARASVLASASRWEGFSNAIAEALACGCPVAATDCPGGVREILADGRFGALVPVGDPHALADALREILDHPPDRAALRARAEEFRLERVVPLYVEAIEAVLARSQAPVA